MSSSDANAAHQQRALDVESRSARREFTQCQNCNKDKDKYRLKLLLCTGCKIATYCSPACQKEHWRSHKDICLRRRKATKETEELDKEALELAQLTGTAGPVLTPSQVITELRAFTQKFNAALFQAGFNALRLHELAHTWEQCIVFVSLRRLPNLPEDAKPWSRYSVEFIMLMPIELVAARFDADNKYGFVETKKKYDDEQLEKGFLGGITILISGRCPPLNTVIHNMTCIGFGSHSKDAIKIEGQWQETFMDTVEKMCGRNPANREREE